MEISYSFCLGNYPTVDSQICLESLVRSILDDTNLDNYQSILHNSTLEVDVFEISEDDIEYLNRVFKKSNLVFKEYY